MSHPVRRVLAALGMMAALLLAVPAPSRAAGLRELPTVREVASGVWTWLERLLPSTAWATAIGKDEQQTSAAASAAPATPPAATSDLSDQGSMIDPNGNQ